MNGIWFYVIAFILIWIVALAFKNRLTNHGFEIEFPVIMWRTQRFRAFIDRIANAFPRFWKWFMNFGIVISFIAMALMTWILVSSLSTIAETPSVSIILPGVEMPGSSIYVPLGSGLLALATVLIVHEFSHGILARVEKINIKSIGLMLFAVLPGAFVEPDEEELKQTSKLAQLRVYAAGSVANMSLALIALIIFSLISSYAVPAAFTEDGIEISNVIEDSPSNGILREGMIIHSINNQTINDSNDYLDIVETFVPNTNTTLGTNQGTYEITLAENPDNSSRGFLGIQASRHYEIQDSVANVWGNDIPWVLFTLSEIFQWIFIINLGVGLFNLLPIKPLDGGRMFELLLSYKLSPYWYKPIVKTVSYILAVIIVFSLLYSFMG